MQQNLFEQKTGNVKPNKNLVLKAKGKKQLSKEQKQFNSLVKRVENLQKECRHVADNLTKCLNFYSEHIDSLEDKVADHLTACTKIYYSHYKKITHFTRPQLNILEEIIALKIDEIFSLSSKEPDDEIKAIFEKLSGESIDDLRNEAFSKILEEAEENLKAEGYDINLKDIKEKMTEEEMAAKFKELQEEVIRQKEAKADNPDQHKKTKKEIAQEQLENRMANLRKTSLTTIYKKLVKILHPDLEQDEEVRKDKEELMKQLTVAYDNNDLHKLLKLELEFVLKEEHNLEKLTDKRLADYNFLLKEQVKDLEEQIYMEQIHPRYNCLEKFDFFPHDIDIRYLEHEKDKLKNRIASLEIEENKLKQKDALKYIRAVINEFKAQKSDDDFGIDFDDMSDEDIAAAFELIQQMFGGNVSGGNNKPKGKKKRR